MKTKIRRRCACECGGITNPGRRYIQYHHRIGTHWSEDVKEKISVLEKGKTVSEETKKKQSISRMGKESPRKGGHHTKEAKLKIALANIKYNPDYKYCDEWKDGEYKKDLLKDYCENMDCKGRSNNLIPHHINLNPKDCRPFNVMTLCNSCHSSLHRKLEQKKRRAISPQDYLIVIRKDRITYIHKATRQIIATIKRREGS